MLGTGGIIPPPKGYWAEIQKVLRRYDILLIADEVICAFGRVGARFGCDLYDITPDLITVAKGLTSGYLPLSAAIVGSAFTTSLKVAQPPWEPSLTAIRTLAIPYLLRPPMLFWISWSAKTWLATHSG